VAVSATSTLLRVSRHMQPQITGDADYLAGSLRTIGQMARTTILAVVASVREICAAPLVPDGETSREQIAALVAQAWSGPVRYRLTQALDPPKARRTLRRSARIYQVARKPEVH
jgi:hypothetical protein